MLCAYDNGGNKTKDQKNPKTVAVAIAEPTLEEKTLTISTHHQNKIIQKNIKLKLP